MRNRLFALLSLLVLAFVLSCKTAPAAEDQVAPDAETAASEPWAG